MRTRCQQKCFFLRLHSSARPLRDGGLLGVSSYWLPTVLVCVLTSSSDKDFPGHTGLALP